MPTYRCVYINDYRQGPSVYVHKLTLDDEEVDYEGVIFEFEVTDCTMQYKACVFGGELIDADEIISKDFGNFEDARQFILQVYSHVNNMSPFVVTGMTSGYHDKGDYGDSIAITHDEIGNVNCDYIPNVFGFVIDEDGDVMYELSINPPE